MATTSTTPTRNSQTLKLLYQGLAPATACTTGTTGLHISPSSTPHHHFYLARRLLNLNFPAPLGGSGGLLTGASGKTCVSSVESAKATC